MGAISVCLELVTGILTKDVVIEVTLLNSSGGEYSSREVENKQLAVIACSC